MRLRIYQSDKGDCLLISGTGGGNILVDGGMKPAFQQHVRDDLGKLAKSKKSLDLVYVSHIDQDHISGVLELLDNIMAWRVYDYRKSEGHNVKPPEFPRMPAVKEIWHNAFSEVIKNNAGAAERLLAQSSLVLGLSTTPELIQIGLEHHELAFSVAEAMRVSQRISASQLNIPLNSQFDGKLAMVRSPVRQEAKIGKMKISLIGPFKEDIERIRKEWDDWLRKNRTRIQKLKKDAEADARSIGNEAASLSNMLSMRINELGNRDSVTAPNLASIMLLLEEGGKTVLLTGDGHWSDILKGLKHHKKFDKNGKIHLNVLKVQHHGSEHNYHSDMAERVTADHYIFCGNGKHENPDIAVVKLICDTHRKTRPKDTFTLWFNCAPQAAPDAKTKAHMKLVEKEVDRQIAASKKKIKVKYLDKSYFDLTL